MEYVDKIVYTSSQIEPAPRNSTWAGSIVAVRAFRAKVLGSTYLLFEVN